MENKPTINIQLTQIKCNETSERGHDEVYIMYNLDGGKDKRFPDKDYVSMESGSIWKPNLPLSFSDTAVVGLYDSDNGKDEFLGSYTYLSSTTQPSNVTVSNNSNGASYNLSTDLI